MSEPDVCLVIDPGASQGKYLLYRKPSFVAVHSVSAAVCPISEQEYDQTKDSPGYDWGAGVVRLQTREQLQFYQVGVERVTRTAQNLAKWPNTVVKVLAVLERLSQATRQPLKVALKILLPLDEYMFRRPLMMALAEALECGSEVNGKSIANVKIISAGCVPEGAGLVGRASRLSAALMCGHCDLSFLMGCNDKLDNSRSFTIAGAGAILPLRLSRLPVFGSEINTAKLLCLKQWKALALDGLTVKDVKTEFKAGLAEYALRLAANLDSIAQMCRDADINELVVAGGSAPLVKGIVQKQTGLICRDTEAIEQHLARDLRLTNPALASRLVDAYLIWRRMPTVKRYLSSLEQVVADPRLTRPVNQPMAQTTTVEVVSNG